MLPKSAQDEVAMPIPKSSKDESTRRRNEMLNMEEGRAGRGGEREEESEDEEEDEAKDHPNLRLQWRWSQLRP